MTLTVLNVLRRPLRIVRVPLYFTLTKISLLTLRAVLELVCFISVGRDGSVGIATGCGLGGTGIELCCGRDFPQPSRRAPGPTQTPVRWVPILFPGDKAAGPLRWPPTSAEVKERVELYFYFPSGRSLPV